jgi:hypothetical protein
VHNLTSLNCCYIWKQLYPSGIHIAYYCYELMVCLETFLPVQHVHYLWPLWIAAVCVILLPIQYVNYLLAFWTDAVFGKISTHITCVLHINTLNCCCFKTIIPIQHVHYLIPVWTTTVFGNNCTHITCISTVIYLTCYSVWNWFDACSVCITCYLSVMLLCF